jgi:hypothetical protein
VQVINRVDWAGVVKGPDPDELGWKETVRMNPLEDIIVAVQAKAPVLPAAWDTLPVGCGVAPNPPCGIPDSVRPKDVTQPLGSMMAFTQPWPYVADDPTKQPSEFQTAAVNPANTMNEMTNFGWEYVWHCHLLGHEENDMMRPLVLTQVSTAATDAIAPTATASVAPAPNAAGWNKTAPQVTLSAVDNPGGSGVALIQYSINGGVFADYLAPIAVATEGTTTIQYQATDVAGNISLVSSLVVKLDTIAPVFTVAPTATPGARSSVAISGTAADGGTVGVASGLVTGASTGTYSISGPSPSSGTFSIGTNGSFSFSRTKLKPGAYTGTLTVKDNAGNTITAPISFTI